MKKIIQIIQKLAQEREGEGDLGVRI